jgi:hypothetical protein
MDQAMVMAMVAVMAVAMGMDTMGAIMAADMEVVAITAIAAREKHKNNRRAALYGAAFLYYLQALTLHGTYDPHLAAY